MASRQTLRGKIRVTCSEVGRDRHASITDVYEAPFEFTGVIHAVDVRIESG